MRCMFAAAALVAFVAHTSHAQQAPSFDDVFVSITDVDSTIHVDARYFGADNFIGRPIAGYEAPKCLLTREAANALAAVQAELRTFGLGLRTYDCYRPQRAVNDFVAWARDTADVRMKHVYYPRVHKRDLFSEGYIAERSGHSRGSTVDLTIIPLRDDFPASELAADGSLDMGTPWDFFDPLSHTANPAVTATAARNRLLLRTVMAAHGFRNYDREWWHFTLAGEPFPETWHDEPVR
jgi:zinc D-Ala-D-Ala dipeptidase